MTFIIIIAGFITAGHRFHCASTLVPLFDQACEGLQDDGQDYEGKYEFKILGHI